MSFNYFFPRSVFIFLICLFAGSSLIGSNVLVVGSNGEKVLTVLGYLTWSEHCGYYHIVKASDKKLLPLKPDEKYSPRGERAPDLSRGLLSVVPHCDVFYFILDQSFPFLVQSFSFAKLANKTVVLHLYEGLSDSVISEVTDILRFVDVLVVDQAIMEKAEQLLDLTAQRVLVIDKRLIIEEDSPRFTTRYVGKERYADHWGEFESLPEFVMSAAS